jgi:3,4-dihydroxy 2-butanone 4-phosphate synthase/GTP cyclohydrolase II
LNVAGVVHSNEQAGEVRGMSAFSSIEEAIEKYKSGKMLIVIDDENRENEGDLILAGEWVNAEAINFMATYGRGLICVSITEERARELDLPMMVQNGKALHGTLYTVSVDAMSDTTTGISAHDRAVTIKALVDPATHPEDLARPGHVFPLISREGGVLRRAGHTEAATDLARLAGLKPVSVLCEIMDDDGSMARVPKLIDLTKKHDCSIITIEDLIKYRRKHEKLVKKVVETEFPTKYGKFRMHVYETTIGKENHLAIVKGDVRGKKNILVRVHSSCLTGDVFGSLRCDCGEQVQMALRRIEEEGLGVFLYMNQEGRGIGLTNKLRAYALQDRGLDTVEANEKLGFKPDLRDYGIGAQILADLGLTSIRVLTNNPKKVIALKGYGLKITGQVSIEIKPNEYNRKYLQVKRDKLGHLISVTEEKDAANN